MLLISLVETDEWTFSNLCNCFAQSNCYPLKIDTFPLAQSLVVQQLVMGCEFTLLLIMVFKFVRGECYIMNRVFKGRLFKRLVFKVPACQGVCLGGYV